MGGQMSNAAAKELVLAELMEDSQDVIRRKVFKQLEPQLQESLSSYRTGSRELIESLEEIEAKAAPLVARLCAQPGAGSAALSASGFQSGLATQVALRLLPSAAFFGCNGGGDKNDPTTLRPFSNGDSASWLRYSAV